MRWRPPLSTHEKGSSPSANASAAVATDFGTNDQSSARAAAVSDCLRESSASPGTRLTAWPGRKSDGSADSSASQSTSDAPRARDERAGREGSKSEARSAGWTRSVKLEIAENAAKKAISLRGNVRKWLLGDDRGSAPELALRWNCSANSRRFAVRKK